MSTIPEIVPLFETISQTAQEGLGVGGQVIATSEMPEVGQSDVETSQPVVSGSTSEMRLDEMPTAGTKLQSVSEKKSVKVELFEASNDSEWFDAIEKKNCKLLLQLFRSDRSLWVQTGLTGRSVLHVAVMQGCSELVRELHYYDGDLVPCGKNWRTPFEFLWENARDGRLKDASAQDIWLVMEGPSVKIGNQNWFRREVSTDRSRDDYIKSHVECTMRVDDKMLSLRDAIQSIADEKDFRMDENDVDFNFENVERKELYVHMACSRLRNVSRNVHKEEDWKTPGCDQIVEFIIAIFTDLGGKNLLQKLFDQKDAQGRTVLQILVLCQGFGVCGDMLTSAFKEMLKILPDACVNALDKAGRTLLHWAVAHDVLWAVPVLMRSEKARRDLTFQTAYIRNITAFHLILLYDHYLAYPYREHLEDELKRDFCDIRFGGLLYYNMSLLGAEIVPLLWAIEMNRNYFVEVVMGTKEYKKLFLNKENVFLGHAASLGNVEILQLFLRKDDFDKVNIVSDPFEVPPLHLAVEVPLSFWRGSLSSRSFDEGVHCNDFISIELLEKKLGKKDLKGDSAVANTDMNKYSVKQVCANLLLQAGADILSTDKRKRMADPGMWAPNEARIWWYELVAKETHNIKKDLNAAGTGTAVVATLVATASFVGPLTPPLNYVAMSSGTGIVDVGVRVTELLIKVFLVSNGLSFYLAITSIMLAIMPSLPIPKEGLVFGPCDDIKRSRRTISIAMLLASIISVLISFAASSLVVIPLQHRGLMAYSTSLGGLICCIGIIFFFLRFLRLICPRNTVIKKLYQRFGIL